MPSQRRPSRFPTVHELTFDPAELRPVLADNAQFGGPVLLLGDDTGVRITTENEWGELGVPVFAAGYGPVPAQDATGLARVRAVTGPTGFQAVLDPDLLGPVVDAGQPVRFFVRWTADGVVWVAAGD